MNKTDFSLVAFNFPSLMSTMEKVQFGRLSKTSSKICKKYFQLENGVHEGDGKHEADEGNLRVPTAR